MQGHSGPGPWPRPCGRSADTPRSEATQRAWPAEMPLEVSCAAACCNSGMASATRPARVYAYPKGAATVGNQVGRWRSGTVPGCVERRDGLAQVSLTEVQTAESRICLGQAEGVIGRLGQPHRFSPLRGSLVERS